MFDLDLIEQDWKNNSFSLNEEEIIEIFKSEDVTLSNYHKENVHELSAEERLLRAFYKDQETLEEKEKSQKMIDVIFKPKKKHLSKENQKKVVEGSLYLVFDETRRWYSFFDQKLSMEKIYYICLEALVNSVKYMIHCEKPVFRLYILKSIERNIIKHVARYMHITYREAYKMIRDKYAIGEESSFEQLNKNLELLLDFESKEEPEKPSKIYWQLKNEYYYINYIKHISSNQFLVDYTSALENLDDTAKIVMELSFDIDGYRGLTNAEIADYLGIDVKKVADIRKRSIKTLRKNAKLNSYLY